jgi:hypothetical protein
VLYSDLMELKSLMEIDPLNTSQDKRLGFFLHYSSKLIDEFLRRPPIEKKSRTEYYGGTGTQKLLLKSRPVFPDTLQVWVDDSGHFGQSSGAFSNSEALLTFGSDYCINPDQEDGTSREAILYRVNAYWNRPMVRQRGMLASFVGFPLGNVKVTYTAGYTPDSLPDVFRAACDALVLKMAYFFPLGMELTSESYEERSISIAGERKSYLTSMVRELLFTYQNWSF